MFRFHNTHGITIWGHIANAYTLLYSISDFHALYMLRWRPVNTIAMQLNNTSREQTAKPNVPALPPPHSALPPPTSPFTHQPPLRANNANRCKFVPNGQDWITVGLRTFDLFNTFSAESIHVSRNARNYWPLVTHDTQVIDEVKFLPQSKTVARSVLIEEESFTLNARFAHNYYIHV